MTTKADNLAIPLDTEEAKRLAHEHGEKIKNCKCKETIAFGRACDWCRNQQMKDFNFVQNHLGMCLKE